MRSDIVLSRELIPPGSRVLCAVSGGADSVCRLHLIRSLGDAECFAAHFDHALRPDSDRDARFVSELCREWGVPLLSERGDVRAHCRQTGQSAETAARQLRYEFLARAAETCGADLVATAHNKNDNAETVLFHMARGTGLRGLTGIPEKRGIYVRPLLHVSRAEIEAYLLDRDIPHVEDPTNARDDCARNYARHHVMPAMERLHPGALDNMDRMIRSLSEDEAYLRAMAREWLSSQGEELSVSELRGLPFSLAARALRLWLGEDLTRERIQAVLALCSAGPSARADLPGGSVYRRYGVLTRTPPSGGALPPRELFPGQTLHLPEAGMQAECILCEAGEEIQNSFNIFSFSCDNICGKLTVACRRPGDRTDLLGRDGTRSVKKLLMERKIPRERRDLVPVIRDEQGVLALYGVGQSRRAFPAPGEKFYKIIFRKNTEDRQE